MVPARARLWFPALLARRRLTFHVRRQTPLHHAGPDFCWFHPRVAAVPGNGGRTQRVVMTLNQHLDADDHYSGLWYMYTDDLGKSWRGPFEPAQLNAQPEENGMHSSVHDVTPGWHAPSRRMIAIGARTFYAPSGKHVSNQLGKGGTAYAAYDPNTDTWTGWRPLELPDLPIFTNCRSACAQWLVRRDGLLLLPVYYQKIGTPFDGVTVLECRFDGERIIYQRHSTLLEQDTKRGLAEPSIAWQGGRYYLTIRHDDRGYVTASNDGLAWEPMRPWLFDDGEDLGSFNTQQHWLSHSGGLFLAYTSRREHNKHIPRARAPIFMAQVDTGALRVIRETEQVLIPERGLMLGNFGAAAIDERESWVTDAEFLWYSHGYKPTAAGGNGSVWVARVEWTEPNRLRVGYPK